MLMLNFVDYHKDWKSMTGSTLIFKNAPTEVGEIIDLVKLASLCYIQYIYYIEMLYYHI